MSENKVGLRFSCLLVGFLFAMLLFPNASGAADGDPNWWAFDAKGRVVSSPAIGSDGTIYVGSGDGNLYAINPNNGLEQWAFKTEGIVYSSPAIGLDNTIYLGSGDHRIYAINPNGTQKWAFDTGAAVESSPAIGTDGTIYVGSYDNSVYAINPNGTPKWAFETGNYVYSSPAVGTDGTIYVGSKDKKLYAINPDGTLHWTFTTIDHVNASPAIGSDGTIYVGSRDGNLYAINPNNGLEQWAFKTEGRVESSPAIGSDGTIYVGSGDGKLYAINPDGTQKWAFKTGRNVESSPAVGSDGTVYVGSQDGKLYAINADGTLRWTFVIGDLVWVQSSPAIATDGTVYVGAHDQRLYAIEGSASGLVDSSWPKFRHDMKGTGLWRLVSDTTPPMVNTTSPADNVTDVDASTVLTATFSEAMHPSTITPGTFFLRTGSDLVLGAVTYSGTTGTFTPETHLDYNTGYTATVTAGAQDLAGNPLECNHLWSFTTGSNPDAVPPTVTATSPAAGASEVDKSSTIIATFSESMDPLTITAATFLVYDGTTNIAGSVSCSGATATFSPASPGLLNYDTDYVVTITTGTEDLAGNALQADYTWSFSTEFAPDTEPPAIASTSPVASATNVTVNAAVVVTFSEDMDPSTVDATTFLMDDGTGQIPGTVSCSGTIAVFTPLTPLAYDTDYTATITTGARDLGGNGIESDYVWAFSTEQAPKPVISIIPNSLSVSCLSGSSPSSQSVELWNSGGANLDYTITDDVSWLSCIPASGASSGEHDAITIGFATLELGLGTYSATITINGSGATNNPVTIPVTLVVGSQGPIADAGPDQRAGEGQKVRLDGSNSIDVDDGIASYLWEQTAGPVVALSDETTVEPTFTAPEEDSDGVSLTFQLTVTDNGGLQSSDTCIINVSSLNEPPTADAGPDQRVSEGETVTLDGSNSSDVDGTITSYVWEQTAGPVVEMSDETAVEPTFTAPEEGSDGVSLAFRLTVADNGGLRSTDTSIVNVSTFNEPPEADAGPDQRVDEGDTVTLDGSNSTDSDGSIALYLWTQTAGNPVTLSVSTGSRPTFVAPSVDAGGTELAFQLTVMDEEGLGTRDEISVTIDDNGIVGFPEDAVTLLTATGEAIGVELANGGNCTSLKAVDPSRIGDNTNRPEDLMFGLIAMDIKVHTVGGSVNVTIHLPRAAPHEYRWFKYGPGWYDFSNHAVFNGDRTQVTLSLVDGGAGDQDGVANGVIMDPSGLGRAPSASSAPPAPSSSSITGSGGDGGGGGGGCFITAATGGFHGELRSVVLRRIRGLHRVCPVFWKWSVKTDNAHVTQSK